MDTMDTAVTPNFKWEGYDLVKEWRTLMEHVEIGIWLGARGDIYIQRGTYQRKIVRNSRDKGEI